MSAGRKPLNSTEKHGPGATDPPGTAELRRFGVSLAIGLSVVTLLQWWLRGSPSKVLPSVAVVLLVSAAAWPKALRPVHAVLVKVFTWLHWLLTRVLLALAFFCLITPARFLVQLLSKDPLKRRWEPDAPTYWEDPEEQPKEFDRYKNQF